MSADPVDTPRLQGWVKKWQAGDVAAMDALLRAVARKLEKLARKMFQSFPALREWCDTPDIVQGSSMRLFNSLREIQPASTLDFFRLAAANMRRELVDLARRFRGKASVGLDTNDSRTEAIQIEAPVEAVEELELWCRFHQTVEELPVDEREVFSLSFYHSWTQAEIADSLDVDVRTIRRRWQTACRKLTRQLGGRLPGQ